jgi:leader peptidase (prepilin peptidase)/N-methyltransferase
LNKMCTLRRGWAKGIEFFFVSIVRYRSWIIHVPLLLLLSVYTVWIWRVGGVAWHALFTSLMGLAVGGAYIWCVRVICGVSFGAEAMGFGDVTLLAMIGSFVGWQAALITFFLAPLSALVVGTIQWLTTGDNRLAFGPYLSFSALLLIIGWNEIWNSWLSPLFAIPSLVGGVLLASLPLLAILMWTMRQIRNFFDRA